MIRCTNFKPNPEAVVQHNSDAIPPLAKIQYCLCSRVYCNLARVASLKSHQSSEASVRGSRVQLPQSVLEAMSSVRL